MKPIEVRREKVIFVEGQDECGFFEALLNNMAIADVQVIDYGGKSSLDAERFRTLLYTPGFAAVRAYVLTRDADHDEKAALSSLQYVLQQNDQPVPARAGAYAVRDRRSVGIYVLPGDGPGMLEDLCLRTATGHAAMPCVDAYMACLQRALPPKPAERAWNGREAWFPRLPSKARCQTFLAAMYEPEPRLGVAARQGHWDMGHPALNDLKAFLEHLRLV